MIWLWSDASAKDIKNLLWPIIRANGVGVSVKGLPYDAKHPKLEQPGPGDVVLAFGEGPRSVLEKAGLVGKKRTIGSLREKPIAHNGGHYLVTYAPGIVDLDYSRKSEIEWDLQLAIRLHDTGVTAPILGAYRYVNDFADTIAWVKARHQATGKPVPLSVDLETKGLDPWDPLAWIISIFFTYKKGQADGHHFGSPQASDPAVNMSSLLLEQIKWLLTSPMVKTEFANGKFDCNWIAEHWGIEVANFTFDTVLAGSLIDENRSNGLKQHTKIYVPSLGGYDDSLDTFLDSHTHPVTGKKLTKGDMDLVPPPVLLPYAGGDTDATFQNAEALKAELMQDRDLTRFYVELLHPSSRVFEKLERVGVCIDREKYRVLEADLENEIAEKHAAIIDLIPERIKAKHHGKPLSITRKDLMIDFLFTPRGLNLKPREFTAKSNELYEQGDLKAWERTPSTAMEHLEQFDDVPEAQEFVTLLRAFNSANKTLTTYVRGFLKHLRSDGRFHPTYMLHKGDYGVELDSGTVTGRSSAKDPAIQTVPKHTKWAKRLRECYIAPPGHVILNRDFKAGELRVAAVIAQELTLMQAFLDNIDPHVLTASRLNGYALDDFMALKKTDETLFKELRQGAKAGNFGLLYGMSAGGFQIYARVAYGVNLSLSEAQKMRDLFLYDLYPRLPQWHDEVRTRAKLHGYIRSPLGRIRHLPLINSRFNKQRCDAERQAINSPVQSTLSDLTQLSMVLIDREYGSHTLLPSLMCHDAIQFYAPEDEVDLWVARTGDIMDHLPIKETFGWESPIPFLTDAEVGYDMAHMEEYAKWQAQVAA